MSAETVEIVIWGILGIAGLLLAVSRLRVRRKLDWRIGLGIPSVMVSLFVLTTTAPKYEAGFSLMGMLILAGAALMAIKRSDDQVRGDKRERKLITIIAWANDIAECETAAPIAPLWNAELLGAVAEITKDRSVELGEKVVEVMTETHDKNLKTNLMMRYQSLATREKQVVLIAKWIDKQLGSKLGCLAQQTADKLSEHAEMGLKFVGGEITDEQYKTRWESLLEMATQLAEEAEALT
ncbi:hypothetical protein ES703_80208 [subsurface metagenome]